MFWRNKSLFVHFVCIVSLFFTDSPHHGLWTALFCQLWNIFLDQILLYYHILEKPIHFGYKNWVFASGDGCPFKVVPYQGKENGETTGLLGTYVVKGLLEVIQNPQLHEVCFDNFFISVQLLCDLWLQCIKTSKTVRNNRTGNTLTCLKTMQKKKGGGMEFHSVNYMLSDGLITKLAPLFHTTWLVSLWTTANLIGVKPKSMSNNQML